jgi:hypothetical protein
LWRRRCGIAGRFYLKKKVQEKETDFVRFRLSTTWLFQAFLNFSYSIGISIPFCIYFFNDRWSKKKIIVSFPNGLMKCHTYTQSSV